MSRTALAKLLFPAADPAIETEPTSGIRVQPREEDETNKPSGPVKPGLYVVKLAKGPAIWVHVTPD